MRPAPNLDRGSLADDPHRRRPRGLERRAVWTREDTGDGEAGKFESGPQLLDSVQALAPHVRSACHHEFNAPACEVRP